MPRPGPGPLARSLARNGGPGGLARLLISPYGRVLTERLGSDLVRAPVAAFAAHGSAAPDQPGTALFALWQAFYHQVGQWHAAGGSQALTDALARRLASSGGCWRTGAAVTAISRDSAWVTGVVLESGETITARTVVTAIDLRIALLGLLDPPLTGPPAAALAGAHRGNVVQMLVLIAARQLPPYPGARPADYRGLQSYVDSLASLSGAFAQAEAGRLPRDPVPAYAFTPSAYDPVLGPPGQHTVYLACPAAPARLEGGWGPAKEAFADRLIAAVEARAPGFADSITGRVIRTPQDMTRELRWPGAHPMHLDMTLDQIGPFRSSSCLFQQTRSGRAGSGQCQRGDRIEAMSVPQIPGAGPVSRLLPGHRAEEEARIRQAAWVARCVGRGEAAPLRPDDVTALAGKLQVRECAPGQMVFKAGDPAAGVRIVREGRVELSVGAGRRRAVVHLLRPGDVDGDIQLLLGMPLPYTGRAVADARCLFLSSASFEQLLATRMRVARRWLSSVAQRLAASQARVLGLFGQSLTAQAARLLAEEADSGRVGLPQRTLAAMLGVQRPSLNKVLKDLERDGLIRIGYSAIDILDPARLARRVH